ncbi:MAG: HAD hydrolase-like protein [Rickettsiales bacterium]|nr:HAD hydrolase-like protein [Rickettsiales bacterium]
MDILDNILDLKERFDIFIFDAYGVFWDGAGFYEGSREAMAELVADDKIVYILSNADKLGADTRNKYLGYGFVKDTHYNEIITSGDAVKDALLNDEIYFIKNLQARKVYQFGKPNKGVFEGSDYVMVDKLSEAELIYLSVPKLNEEEYNSLKDKYGDYLFESKMSKEGGIRTWESTNIEVYSEKIDLFFKSGLPILNANPDYTALTGVKGSDARIFAIRQGAIAEVLRKLGSEVIEYGKPYEDIFKFIFKIMKNHDINVSDKSRICMVGDTLRTDIKGANNAGICPVLCVETGVTASEISKGKKLEDLIKEEDVFVDYAIKSVGKTNNKK